MKVVGGRINQAVTHHGIMPVTRPGTAVLAALLVLAAAAPTRGAEPTEPVRLPAVSVKGQEQTQPTPHLPAVEGTRIAEGKKTSVADLDQQPVVVDNNHRQTFAQLPGLLVSEMAIPSQLNINYRGIGDPHESEYVLTLQDGIPMTSDWFGYPTTYHAPPSELVERVELLRGGAGLLYGPQPGPVLNFVTARPPADRRFTASTQHTVGSDGLYSTFNQVGGTLEAFGYLGTFHHRQADGARDNADYEVFGGDLKLTWQAGAASQLRLGLVAYESESGEAGRLSLAQYTANRDQTVKPFDRIWITRYVPSLTFVHDLSEQTQVEIKAWGGYQDRFSRRQLNSLTNALDRQEFHFAGLDARVRHFWETADQPHVLTGGFVLYGADSPRSRERGTPLTANSGSVAFDLDRHTYYAALFAENKFQVGRLAIVPAVRVEFIDMQVEENVNLGKTLQTESFSDVVPLVGLGASYDLGGAGQLYGNASQGYRPPKYDDLVNPTRGPISQGSSPSEGETWNFEIGWRGQPVAWFQFDTSLFFVDWDGVVETQVIGPDEIRSNSGRAQYGGWETSAAVDLIGLGEQFWRPEQPGQCGSLSLFGSLQVLETEFVEGNRDGLEPAYAPDYIIKTGLLYRWQDRLKLGLVGQFVDEHFWQDSNTAGSVGTREIAAYSVWDLTVEAKLFRDNLTVLAGINNLFDEDYYSRIRSDGIEPASRRTWYGGVKLKF